MKKNRTERQSVKPVKETPPTSIQTFHRELSASYQSPFPPPEHCERYEALLPGIMDRIATMAEKNLEMKDKMIEYHHKEAMGSQSLFQRGQIIAGTVMVSAVAAIIVGAFLGQSVVIYAGFILAVTPFLTRFLPQPKDSK